MNAEKTRLTLPSDTEILVERAFAFPRQAVWKAFTDPAALATWWGPVGFSTTTKRMEVKPGGQWRFVMHGPDGRDYENLITYLEVVEPDRLVYKHGGEKDVEPVNFTVTVTFDAAGEGTLVRMRSKFPNEKAREFVIREYGADEGAKQNLARLDDHLAATAAASGPGRPFELTRVFEAPRELVWRAWTERDHLAQWFGPAGTTLPKVSLDFRVGGTFHYCMKMPDGSEHWGRWVFREIAKRERLVFVVSFADAAGNPIRNPWDAGWPLEMLSTVTFAEHAGKGRGTVVSVMSEAWRASEAERRKFDAAHDSMRGGWSGTMDKLAEHLGRVDR